MNRADLQALAEERLADAQVLLANKRFGTAFYLAGYIIECALKACIAKLTKAEDFPMKHSTNTVYIHDLKKLAAAAKVSEFIERRKKEDNDFATNWSVVTLWSEKWRYDRYVDQILATLMVEAVADPQHGVLQCLKQHW